MTTKRFFILAHTQARESVRKHALDAPEGWTVTFQEPKKKRIQEEKYHAQIGDIARQTTYAGKKWDAEDMKRILVDEFADEMRSSGNPIDHDGRLIPSEDGRRVIQLGLQTRDFSVKTASQFVEFLYAYGAMRGVVWTDPKPIMDAWDVKEMMRRDAQIERQTL